VVIALIDDSDDWTRLLAGDATGSGDLVERYGVLLTDGTPLVLGQLGQSLDGFIASRTGDARFVTGAEDRQHLHRLRALVDAVIVGVSTVVSDDCQLTVRDVDGTNPTRVVLDPSARAPRGSRVFIDSQAPTLWLVAEDVPAPQPPSSHVEVVRLPRSVAEHQGFAPCEVVALLARRGLSRVLVEGGGVTVSRFVEANAIDRLWVTTAPFLIGNGVPGLRFEGSDRLADALRVPSRRFILGEDVVLELDLRNEAG
jgi:diaminohydroxyphosphoribosylaminopyrimidine deaminase / 5-amino-6-(5-phosphoribosylamino)uracil reductase